MKLNLAVDFVDFLEWYSKNGRKLPLKMEWNPPMGGLLHPTKAFNLVSTLNITPPKRVSYLLVFQANIYTVTSNKKGLNKIWTVPPKKKLWTLTSCPRALMVTKASPVEGKIVSNCRCFRNPPALAKHILTRFKSRDRGSRIVFNNVKTNCDRYMKFDENPPNFCGWHFCLRSTRPSGDWRYDWRKHR